MTTADNLTTIQSGKYGVLHVRHDQIFHFKKGLIGLENLKEMALIPIQDSDYCILHALEEDVDFILVPAHKIVQDYEFHITSETESYLDAKKPEEVAVLLIVHIQGNEIYVNLKAPILLSTRTQKGLQYIITDKDYPVRQRLTAKETERCSS